MSFYYQCECGEKINKLAMNFANSKEERKEISLHYIGWKQMFSPLKVQPLVQCPECGTKYKIKLPRRRNINIGLLIGFLIALTLKFGVGIRVQNSFLVNYWVDILITFGTASIIVVISMVLNNYFEKIDDDVVPNEVKNTNAI